MSRVIILDTESHSINIEKSDIIYNFRSLVDSVECNEISIPLYIEKNSKELRNKYLNLIFNFSQSKRKNNTIYSRLEIKNGVNYWPMTLLGQQCNFEKSPHINYVIKLMAFDKLISELDQFYEVLVVSDNINLVNCIEKWAFANNKIFIHTNGDRKIDFSWLREIYILVKSMAWLCGYLLRCFHFFGYDISTWVNSTSRKIFFGYFNGSNKITKDYEISFFDKYWTKLPSALSDHGVSTRWLHRWIRDENHKTSKDVINTLRNLNSSSNGLQTHACIECFLTLKILVVTLADWIALIYKYYFSLKFELNLSTSNGINLSEFYRAEWTESFLGISSISSLLDINLYERALCGLPAIQRAYYLQENQPWEFALLSAWRNRCDFDYIVGYPHTIIRFWDLRYFFAQCVVNGDFNFNLPDKMAVNGIYNKKALLEGMYQEKVLVDVEALRYLDLYPKNTTANSFENEYKILVLGDYVKNFTHLQLNILSGLKSMDDKPISLYFRPHPNCSIDISDYNLSNLKCIKGNLEDVFKIADIVFTSGMTTAGLEAYEYGLPVITVLTGQSLNLSPLRDIKNVYFISNQDQFIKALKECKNNYKKEKMSKFFNTDKKLPLWISLIMTE